MSPARTAIGRRWLAIACLLTLPSATPSSEAQTRPAVGAPSVAQQPTGAAPARGLTTRYRLVERYAGENDTEGIATYQVAFRETVSSREERPQGGPLTSEFTTNSVFSERVARPGAPEPRQVEAIIRRYESTSVVPDPWEGLAGPKMMNDLEIMILQPTAPLPRFMVLTPGRVLRDQEYRFAIGNPLVPELSQNIPETPLRIGDDWILSRSAASALIGDAIGDGLLSAKLTEVTPLSGDAAGWEEAQVDLEGRVTTVRGPTSLRARLTFRFHQITNPAPAPTAATPNPEPAPAAPVADLVVGLGGLSKIRLTQVTNTPPLAEGLGAVERRRTLVLERRWPGAGPEIAISSPVPEETTTNTWLEYTDPHNRFHFLHPQDMRTKDASELLPTVRAQLESGDVIMLGRARPEGEDALTLYFLGGEQPKIDELFQNGFDRYRAAGFQVDVGQPVQINGEGWNDVEARRIEAILTPPASQPPLAQTRTQFDGYLIHFTQNASLMATASTRQTEVTDYRAFVESILKTFRLGPPAAPTP